MASRLSITDEFLALAKVANEAKTTVELELMVAPEVFEQILGEIRSLVGILFELHSRTVESTLTDVQKERIHEIQADCRHVLADTEHALSEQSSNLFFGTPSDEPNEVAQVRERITSIIYALDEAITRPNCEVLDWLVPNEYNTKVQSDHMSKRATGTYQWFLDSPDYETWTNRKGEKLFYYGDIGVGKSVLASTVIASLQESYILADNVATCYFYCDSIRTKEQSVDHVILAMLWLLLRRMPTMPQPVWDLFKRHEKEYTRPTSDEAHEAFCSVASSFSKVFIIIDGLDDCRLSEGCHKDTMTALLNLQAQAGANMLVTSRTMPRITEASSGHHWVEFRASDEDIAQFVRASKNRIPKSVWSKSSFKSKIVRNTVRDANGVFLNAKLQIDSLAETRKKKGLTKSRGSSVDKGSIYKNAWQRINSQRHSHKELAIKTLIWVVYAQRPLTTIELQHALSIQTDESESSKGVPPTIEDVVWSCCGLLAIDQELDQVRLVHHTATEYFMAMADQGAMWIQNPATMITDSCLTYLSYTAFESGECGSDVEFQKRLASYPFYDYASNYWGHHAVSTANIDRVRLFLKNSSLVEASSQVLFSVPQDQDDHGYSQRTPKGFRSVHLSAIFGLGRLLGSDGLWQDDDLGIDTPVSDGRTLLSYAAEQNQNALAQLLLAKGAKFDCQDDNLETPLLHAAKHGHVNIVRLFLSQWSSFQSTDIYQNAALLHAAARGHAPVVELLLEQYGCYASSIGWESKSDKKRSLRDAKFQGLDAVVRLLLKTWARMELPDKTKPTILSYAIESKHDDSVQLLSTPEQWNTYMLDELSFLVVENRSEEIVELLRRDLTFLPSVDVYLWAINNQHLETILLLLERGPCERFGEVSWEKVLLAAIENGDLALTQVILDFSRHLISWRDGLGRTVLFYACDFGELVIVDALLDKYDADGNAQCTLGRSPLVSAAYKGRYDVVNNLLSRQEIKVETIDHLGRGILSIASEAGKSSLVQRLLERSDIDPDSSGNLRRTPLSWAAAGGHSRIIEHLVRTDLVDVNYADTDGRTPIFWACHQGHQEAVLQLLDAACDTTIRDKSGQTAMHAAAKNGSDALCKMLLGKVDPDVFDYNQNTALMLALDNEHHKVLLLEKGSNVNTADGQGRSLLILSVIHQQGPILRLLIKNNADVTLADGDGLGPLEHAVQIRDCESIHELLRAGSDTTMISASQWYSAFSKQNDHLMLTQEQDGQKTITFHPPTKPPVWPDSSHADLRRRLL
ncbi:hypothetical protein PFICI_02580 [Pestalotiopsis fici W106-1]|uniref:Uncharacterized protein n=1 Tax=Pestalotiopsis fici (strain W106-1 / CGMCC3.15140) TaxID=1229662 RepID=W3XES9_PESFW|nr:uncharacterized protein PFICI_02580 [Pestalotiopsis fici W106-1]ETS84555.1 hypothetical protein PFICI_02580 [Pestalotiopsis fici W106-1]